MENYEDTLNRAIAFLKNCKNGDLKGFDRSVLLRIGDREFCFVIESSEIKKASIAKPDITIEMSDDTFKALASGEMSPMKAYALKKVKVKASLKDIMLLTKLLG
jgi:putative sterol carrier protein